MASAFVRVNTNVLPALRSKSLVSVRREDKAQGRIDQKSTFHFPQCIEEEFELRTGWHVGRSAINALRD